ncbi:glycosyltransferase family 4 protein [Flavobacterium sp.]|uniref:glycosyltransferase family 4 protein n=1 Tax=Flavobacterium sp. TaxID=239 RepID=UPI0037517081
MNKLIRISTVAMSLDFLLKGQLAYLKKKYNVIAVSGHDEHLKKVELREGVHVVDIPMQRSISPLQDLKSLWQLYWLLKKEKPLIVHSITPKAGLLSMIAAYFASVPIRVHTFTGLIFPTKSGFMKQLLILMDKILCICATNIYPEGQGVRNDLIKYKITSKKLQVIANGNVNGIDTNYYDSNLISYQEKQNLRTELKIDLNDFVFIFVGRLVGDKGINELVKAFKNVLLENENAKLLLVGSFEEDLDPLTIETKQEITTNDKIISVGFQNDVKSYFAISNVLVFPSYREGFPNVVMQAGAMGLPCIVTNINGSNEIIIEGENGIIIPVKNANAIYISMNNMIKDNILRTHLMQNARQMIVARYEQEVVWRAILAEYEKLEQYV